MPKATSIFVKAPPDRLTPIASADGVEPGGGQLFARPGEVIRVSYFREDGTTSQTIRRSRNRGDLVLCNMSGAVVDSYELARVPDEVPATAGKKEDRK